MEEKGWQVSTAKEFLGLTPDEAAYIELKLMLSENLKKRRQQKKTETRSARREHGE